jgi:surfeit locus 1 family protein
MLTTLREKKLLVPTVMVALALPVLAGLGMWQLDRLRWKEGLLAAIAERASAPAVPIDKALAVAAGQIPGGWNELEYKHVSLRGRYLNDKELYLYSPHPQLGAGVHVYTPFVLSTPPATLIVNRGFVPDSLKDPASRSEGQIQGETEVIGLIRLPGQHGRFVPDNEPKSNIWFWRDFDGMIDAAFPAGSRPTEVIPLFVDAEGAAPGGWPKGGVTELKLPNRHLEYALTWFGLAAALLAVYAIYLAGRLRRSDGRDV